MKHAIQSTLNNVIQEAWQEPNLAKAKTLVLTYVSESKIKEEDKKRMTVAINEIKYKNKLDYYLANSLLKYEGLSVNQ